VVRPRDLARGERGAAPDHRCVRARVMRRPVRRSPHEADDRALAGHRGDDRRGEGLVVLERRLEPGNRAREEGLAGPRRPHQEEPVSPCERDLERPPSLGVAADVREVWRIGATRDRHDARSRCVPHACRRKFDAIGLPG